MASQLIEVKLPEPQQKVFSGEVFPYIVSPAESSDLADINKTCNWVENNRQYVESCLIKYGAVLFRGFPIENPEMFDKFVKSFGYDALPYVGGAAPRKLVVGDVFTSNEAPPEMLIPFHHEMAQVPTFPNVLFFFCNISPSEGGQTPLVLSNLVYQQMLKLNEPFVNKLLELGVKYTRVLPNGDDPTSPIGRGWQSTYGTTNKQEAEKKALELVGSIEWLSDGCLKTITDVLPAIRDDKRTGKMTWFNSVIAVYRGWKDSRNSPETSITFGDGSPMDPDVMTTLENTLNDLAIDFSWKINDVVMVDNRQVLHGRRSFVPPRQILAALCK
ncbi:uncharacterized protein LOC134705393 [Mytilus trossulus]|uniref:uncharacterized protein LOC134705393 n=1 Tax=Mytilus trossulus TaxID=6551 RepID=UPI0030056401